MPDDTIHLGELFQILLRHNRLIATVMVLVTALTVFWVGTRTPRYKASATLLLEQDESTGGVLSELASLTSDPAAEAEIALIRSRSLAEVTAAPPETWLTDVNLFDGTDADYDPVAAGDTTSMEGMGLETIVDAHDRRPSKGIMRRLTGERAPDHRLRAWMQPMPGHEGDPELVRDLDVYFVDRILNPASLRLAWKRSMFRTWSSNSSVCDCAFKPVEPTQVRSIAFGFAVPKKQSCA